VAFVIFVIALPAAVVGLALLALLRVLCLGLCRCVLCSPLGPTRRVCCGLFVVSAGDSVVPWMLFNGGGTGETKAGGVCSPPSLAEGAKGSAGWCCNRWCCCCGAACCCLGLPCCPPPRAGALVSGDAKAANRGGTASASNPDV